MILLPIGHERSGVRRLPWVTFGVIAVCTLAFFATGRAALQAEDDRELTEDVVEAIEYYLEHPYLELDRRLRERLPEDRRSAEQLELMSEAFAGLGPERPGDAQSRAAEQRVLDDLVRRALRGFERHPLYRWGLVPAAVSPVGLVSHMFLHVGWLHLLGNLLILYLAGPFVEDVWGRPLFGGFYLASGIVAALAFVALTSDPNTPMIGASGAIAGVMGAFLVRYHATRIRFFYMVGVFFRGTFSAAAWIMLPLWFAQQLFFALLTHDSGAGGVAYWAHVGGFGFGVAAAVGIRRAQVEERFIHPRIEGKIHTTVHSNEALDRALALRDAGDREGAFAMLRDEARRTPEDRGVAEAFWAVAVELERPGEAVPAMLGLVACELRSGDVQLALEFWAELRRTVPDVRADAALLLRLARALLDHGERAEATATLRRALLAAGTRPGAVLARRLATLAAEIDPAVARAACRVALAQPDLDPDGRAAIERMLARMQPPGTGPGAPLSPAAG